eukprot:973587-Pelagomonas_calceolata.AAC.2
MMCVKAGLANPGPLLCKLSCYGLLLVERSKHKWDMEARGWRLHRDKAGAIPGQSLSRAG